MKIYLQAQQIGNPEKTIETKGEIINRLTPSQLDYALERKLVSEDGFTKIFTTTTYPQESVAPPIGEREIDGDTKKNIIRTDNVNNTAHKMTLYKKEDGTAAIVFSVTTDNTEEDKQNPRYKPDIKYPSLHHLERCTKIFDEMNEPNSEFKQLIQKAIANGARQPIRITMPIATTYGRPVSQHFRTISLDVTLDGDNLTFSNAFLINSRNGFFGRSCPTQIIADIEKQLKCKCATIFTGQQSGLKADNNSCGPRTISYLSQLIKRNKNTTPEFIARNFIDEVKCSTRLMLTAKILASIIFPPVALFFAIKFIAVLLTKKQPKLTPPPESAATITAVPTTQIHEALGINSLSPSAPLSSQIQEEDEATLVEETLSPSPSTAPSPIKR